MEKYLQNDDCRAKEFFGFDWNFALTDKEDKPGENEKWREVQLPHDWSVDYPVKEDAPCCGSGGYTRCGIGWYKKSFEIVSFDQIKDRVTLLFEGVYMNCTIWINGKHAGGHIYGYTSFEIDATNLIKEGINEILVRVNNSHQPGSRWYTGSGITRDVYIVRTGKSYIPSWATQITTSQITDKNASIDIRSEVVASTGLSGKLELVSIISNDDGKEIIRVGSKLLNEMPQGDIQNIWQKCEIASPSIWSIETPSLYTLTQKLTLDDKTIDECSQKFGVREISFDKDKGFLLNKEKLTLKGVCLHHDGGCVGAAVPKEVWRRRLLKLKAMGTNAIRLSHNPSDISLLDLADELGFVVLAEAFDEWENMKGKEFGSNTHESRGYSEWFTYVWRDDLSSLVKRDRNHPSIIMWSIGNEIREQVTEGGDKVARRLAGLVHSLDDTRPITAACDQEKAEPFATPDSFLNELDVVGVNYVDRWRDRTETFFDEERAEHPDWILYGSEDISVSGNRNDYSLTGEKSVWNIMTYNSRMLKAERLWKYIFSHKFVCGSFMWTGIDYLGECFWPQKSASAGVLDTCGFEKDGYYFYKSIWTKAKKEPVLKVTPNLNLDYKKGEIYPVIVYTNCYKVELFAGGVSYGTKAYEYPTQGMTKEWSHFDRPLCPVTTNDLHLSWDVPYSEGELVAVGYDISGKEIIRDRVAACGVPAKLDVEADTDFMTADGRSVMQLEIALLDKEGTLVTNSDCMIKADVKGGELLGMDNGDQNDHTLYKDTMRKTYAGLCYVLIRAPRTPGMITVNISTDGIPSFEREFKAK